MQNSPQKRQDILSKLEGLLTPKEPPKKKKTGAFIELEESDPVFTSSPAAELRKQDVDFLKILPSAIHGIYKMQGPVGPRGPRGESIQGEKGEKGDRGLPGKDGEDASMEDMMVCAEKEVKAHEKTFDHKLIHDPKMLGEYELDVSTIKDGDFLQVKGKRIVGVKVQSPDMNGLRSWVASQGVSNMRHMSVTSSRELEPFIFWVVDASAGDITLTIPSAAGLENAWFEIMRLDNTANTVTVVPTGAETFSGMTEYVLSQWTDLQLFGYNSNYLIRQAT